MFLFCRRIYFFSEPRGLANIRTDKSGIREAYHLSRQLGVCHEGLLIGAQACHESPKLLVLSCNVRVA